MENDRKTEETQKSIRTKNNDSNTSHDNMGKQRLIQNCDRVPITTEEVTKKIKQLKNRMLQGPSGI